MNTKDIIDGAQKLYDGLELVSPADLAKLARAYDYSIKNFAKFKERDLVQLKNVRPGSIDFGGHDIEHFIVDGATGIVDNVSLSGNGFRYGIRFDGETYREKLNEDVEFGWGSGYRLHPRRRQTVWYIDEQFVEEYVPDVFFPTTSF